MLNIEQKKETILSEDMLHSIDEFEDYVERLQLSNAVVYDESFHKEVVNKYRQLMVKINKSELNTESKAFVVEMVSELFSEHIN